MSKKICILILSCVLVIASGMFFACSKPATPDVLPPFEYDYSESPEEFGDGIVIDGKLDEEAYKSRRFLSEKVKNTPVIYNMTSVYGKKGIYFAFHILDNEIYYNEERETWSNSGIEFCVGSPYNLNRVYEVDINVGGKGMIRKFTSAEVNPYREFLTDMHSKVSYNGALNTPECTEYSAEIYIPYRFFNDKWEDTPVEFVYVNPAIVRAESEDPSNNNRLWYSIGEEERNLEWSPAFENWYKFSDAGLIASTVTLKTTGNGRIEGKDYAIAGDDYLLKIYPEKGNILEGLNFGGKEVAEEITYKDGVACYTGKIDSEIEISAQFAKENSEVFTLQGKCYKKGETAGPGSPVSAKVMAVSRGQVYQAESSENGAYSLKLPKGVYEITCSKQGSLDVFTKIEMNKDKGYDFSFERAYPLETGPDWDLSELAKGTAKSLNSGWYVTNAHTYISSKTIIASANISLPINSGADKRAGFVFRTDNRDVFVCICANGEGGNNRYQVQLIGDEGGAYWTGIDNLPNAKSVYKKANSSEGVPFLVLCNNGKITVWIDGEKIYSNYSAFLEVENTRTGLRTCGGGTFRHLKFDTASADGNPILIDSRGNGTVTCDKKAFKANETLNFDVVPEKGFDVKSFTVNGVDLLSKVQNNKFTYETGSQTVVVVDCVFDKKLEGNATISGSLTDEEGNPMDGVTVTLENRRTGEKLQQVTADGGKFAYGLGAVLYGDYILTVTKADFNDYIKEVHIEEDKVIDIVMRKITLKDKYVISMNNEFDISKIEEGTISYADTAFEGHLNLKHYVKEGEDMRVEANIREQANFSKSDLRYGFELFAGKSLHLDLVRDLNGTGLQITDWSFFIGGALNSEELAAWQSAEGLVVGVKRINGIIMMYTKLNGTEREVARLENEYYGNAACTIGIGVWNSAPSAEFRNFTVGDVKLNEGDIIFMENKFDVSRLNEGVVVYTDPTASEGHLNLNYKADANDDIKIEANLRKQTGFVKGGLRYGFDMFADTSLHLNIITDSSGVASFQISDWTFWANGELSAEEIEAWQSETGLTVGAKRENGIIMMYTKLNGTEREICRLAEGTKYANAEMTIGFGAWDTTPGAEFRNIVIEVTKK